MSLSDNSKSVSRTDGATLPVNAKKNAPDHDVGTALRSIYERTIGEDVPAEMLDLLNKLD